jgi:hypothetical protein
LMHLYKRTDWHSDRLGRGFFGGKGGHPC